MNGEADFLESIWDGILSREHRLICDTFMRLDETSQQVVVDHLKRMATEDGWHPEQVVSAREALAALKKDDSAL